MIHSEVLIKGEPRFNMVGQRLPDSLHDTDQVISPGLLERLHRYGLTRVTEIGFTVDGFKPSVYTMDGDLPASERYYCIEFIHQKGGMIGVQGIMIGKGGWPCLDHGICTGEGYE
ncbi:hypothetical protein EPK99_06340 [Neorhizobium lilium]|uniref:Uncharacterized protein n=1 Tax=Neorhizobium lilium TaxID=2503024 RepID=A0A444LGU1_9HYPH|nr:hypothetical protein [Neorhizobium lilium]RWX78251.1 hypothetical protein EPK99_06340 [Neorhizobium lilium]